MDNDAAPRPRTVPLWLRITGWGAAIYLVLWAATLVCAARNMRAVRQSLMENALSAEHLDHFDPHVRPSRPKPGAPEQFFMGNLRCPCPLIASFDVANTSSSREYAGRTIYLYLFFRDFPIGHQTYWNLKQ
jgi:hypothetical protein